MQIPRRGTLVALIANPRTSRDVLRLASPRFDVVLARTATEALAAVQAGGGAAVLVAEHPKPPTDDDGNPVPKSSEPGALALLEAARIRCPNVHRVLLAWPEVMPALIPIIHAGTAHTLVPLPVVVREFLAAILPPATEAGSQSA
jgi:hypothetical protein